MREDNVHLELLKLAGQGVDVPHIVIYQQNGLARERSVLLDDSLEHLPLGDAKAGRRAVEEERHCLYNAFRGGRVLDNNGAGHGGKTSFLVRRKVSPGVNNDRELKKSDL